GAAAGGGSIEARETRVTSWNPCELKNAVEGRARALDRRTAVTRCLVPAQDWCTRAASGQPLPRSGTTANSVCWSLHRDTLVLSSEPRASAWCRHAGFERRCRT